MGARGKQPRPAEEQLRRGNPGRRNARALQKAAAPDATTTTAADPTKPKLPTPTLGLTKGARRYWQHVAPLLVARMTLKDGDLIALARYCNLLSDYDSLRRAITTPDGDTEHAYKTTSTAGDEVYKARPEIKMLRDLEPKLLALENHFGLTPSARAGVSQKLMQASSGSLPPAKPQHQNAAGQPDTNSAASAKAAGIPPAPASPIGLLAPKIKH